MPPNVKYATEEERKAAKRESQRKYAQENRAASLAKDKERKRLAELYVRRDGTPGRTAAEHKAAQAAATKRWRERHPEKAKALDAKYRQSPASQRRTQMRRRYGMTPDQILEMCAAQGDKCSICAAEVRMFAGKGVSGVVDHCHATGQVRAILCPQCNVGLGSFRDRPGLLEAAAQYLRAHSAQE